MPRPKDPIEYQKWIAKLKKSWRPHGHEFKKGQISWNKGKPAPWAKGEKNHNWKGGPQLKTCAYCKKRFWVSRAILNSQGVKFCSRKCSWDSQTGKSSSNWKGGKIKNNGGYILILDKNNKMANIKGYVLEHRLIVSKHIGRDLTKDEVVHHINRNKQDNRIENLQLTDKQHHPILDYCPNCGWRIV